MPYSLILPYGPAEGRAEAFAMTAESLVHWYAGRQLEVCLCIDPRVDLRTIEAPLDVLWPHFIVRVDWMDRWTRNSACAINQCVRMATGDRIILSSPEVCHNADCLAELDALYRVDEHAYYVLSVAELDQARKPYRWLQHSQYLPRALHFLSSMTRANWDRVGGFDEAYAFGIAFEDNAYERAVVRAGIRIQQEDLPNAHGLHQWHSRGYQEDARGKTLWAKNAELYRSMWG